MTPSESPHPFIGNDTNIEYIFDKKKFKQQNRKIS